MAYQTSNIYNAKAIIYTFIIPKKQISSTSFLFFFENCLREDCEEVSIDKNPSLALIAQRRDKDQAKPTREDSSHGDFSGQADQSATTPTKSLVWPLRVKLSPHSTVAFWGLKFASNHVKQLEQRRSRRLWRPQRHFRRLTKMVFNVTQIVPRFFC